MSINTAESHLEQQTSSSFASSSGGHNIFCNYWNPVLKGKEAPKAVVFIIHGYAEHCLWYDGIAKPLTELGILVCGHDHVGHGQSDGYPAHVDTFDTYVNDILQHVDIVSNAHPNVPRFLVGHSMGGALTIITAQKHPNMFQGSVIIGPAIVPDPNAIAPWKITLGKIISYMCPKAPIEKLSSEWVCRDKAVVHRYDSDPLVYHGGMRAGWGMALLAAMEHIQATMAKNTFPFLLIHGEDDKLCDVTGSELFHRFATSSDKTLSLYPGAYHQVHSEPGGVKEKCIQEIVDWITQRIHS